MSYNSNPLYSQQWHFNLIGDIETIWAEYSGDGVLVAVYDDGVEDTHDDLDGNYDYGSELSYDNGDPNFSGDAHGTSVAGIIAAENNNEGGVGVAWGADLVGVDFLNDAFGSAALRDMSQFDVINNSWGYSGFYSTFDINGGGWASTFAADMMFAVENGRGGLGSIVVKSAGNSGRNVDHSSQNDPFSVLHEAIIVGATDANGFTEDYSSYGVNLLITAPSAAVTTDREGFAGYEAGDYNFGFNGTSASAPVVSGVAALILQANPNLGWRDVQQIMAMSASHTGSAYGSAAAGFEDYSWFANGADNWNGGGMSYHNNYGYGMIDAFAAVRMAEVWSEFFPVPQDSSNVVESLSYYTSPAFAETISSTQPPVVDTIFVSETMDIEHIYVIVDGSHSWSADLEIVLTAPDGTEFILNDNNGGYTDRFGNFIEGTAFAGYTFGVTAAMGMDSYGLWTITISDTVNLDDGLYTGFGLEFAGTTPDNDDVYHFTDDFLSYEAVEGTRGDMTDTNGGTDWLNLAAVTGDVLWDVGLFTGVRFLAVDTVRWVDFGNDEIENIATGDGDDDIWGNDYGNIVMTGRGNDSVWGSFGDDSVYGGAGNDTLRGAYDDDMLLGEEGNDTLEGGTGSDTLNGGLGNDELSGESGADHFIFDGGNDWILDFTAEDLVFIDPAIWGGTIAGLLAGAQTINGDLFLDFGSGNSLTFAGVTNTSELQGKVLFVGETPPPPVTTPNAITIDISAAGQAAGLALQDVEGALSDLVIDAEIQAGQTSTGFTSISVGGGETIVYAVTGTGLTYGTDAFGTFLTGGTVTNVNVTINGTFVGSFSGTVDAAQLSAAAFAEVGGSLGALEAFFSAVNWTYNGSFNNDILPEGFLSEDGVPFALNGEDSLNLGGGNDSVFLANGDDFANGGDGDDSIGGGDGNDTLEGGNGTDTLEGGSGSDTLEATGGNGNLLRGGAGDDVLIGGWGSDILQGNDGADSFSGGTGADDLYIDGQDTFFDGGGGYDRLIAVDPGGVNVALSGTNIERVIGGTGDDVFDGTGVALGLVISGEGGNDTLTGGSATDQVSGGAGDDVLIGGGGDDFLFGDGGSDSFEGGAGDDRFFAESIDQSFDGGAGYDRLFLLDNGDFTFALAGTGIERVNSGDGNDVLDATGVTDAVVLSGAGGNDALTGGSNNDVLAGGDGQDTLEGGSGFDSFFGGAGADSFVFEDGSGVDFLVGWEDGLDLLDFSGHAQVNGLSDLTITDNGVNSRIEFADGDALIVIGYTGGFDASDFDFV
ncbi:hypothetical protein roselon_00952 [Roseibacterium elongatum DSM 19469]|uniref:P/Homo B domain-containing protein n=1 Tax=Roseicyclus elongatus DSM 19469 TaxID=1294273 RepID=W8RZQ5_9RHOB|nr:S8 family serine peptidase [Roseibacterium elongatum]AHM03352.1 hypothetical protein roselon_00952 [Roseibacterium elongatum DSM 19469]